MKTLLVHAPGNFDGTSFYRALGPFAGLRSLPGWRLERMPTTVYWTDIAWSDALFLQRPVAKSDVDLALMAKDLGKKVWLDYDDDLFAVPRSNPYYRDAQRSYARIKQLLALADVVTVSTPALGKALAAHTRSAPVVVPNAWDDSFLRAFAPDRELNKIVFWRGSNTHNEDLESHLPEIAEIARRHPDWKWHFVGDPYWRVTEILQPGTFAIDGARDVVEYLKSLETFRPGIAIVPLKDNAFNRSKSNVAWLESTYMGTAVVAPDWPEWQRPGISTYKPGELADAFDRAAHDYAQNVRSSRQYVETNLLLSHVNRLRAEILEALT